MDIKHQKVAIVGLGYVGLPLAVEFGKIRDVVGFDISSKRVDDLRNNYDSTLEVATHDLVAAKYLTFSTDPTDLKSCGIFIITVPTPIDRAKRPDLTPLLAATKIVGGAMQRGAIVIYESTVYPGCTEEVCVPLLEEISGLKFNQDFFCGYSPERINPGDKQHRLIDIKKVTSGSTLEAASYVDSLYREIIVAGTYSASSMKVAEAAKVIENTQRDLNIALMNELSLIFRRIGIDTLEVLKAAETKWNFLPFRPGLVGGHCIGVDPYYLTHKAQEVGYHPEVILAGRRINDSMPTHVADETVKLMLRNGKNVIDGNILILGLTFKENCPDIRNTKVVDIITALNSYNANVDVYDPWVDPKDALSEYGMMCLEKLPVEKKYAAIVVAVGHRQFVDMGAAGIRALGEENSVVYDVKGILGPGEACARL